MDAAPDLLQTVKSHWLEVLAHTAIAAVTVIAMVIAAVTLMLSGVVQVISPCSLTCSLSLIIKMTQYSDLIDMENDLSLLHYVA